MFDRQRGMDIPHSTLVLQEMGKLHTASLLLERTLPNNSIADTWDIFNDAWKNDNMKGMFDAMIRGQIEEQPCFWKR